MTIEKKLAPQSATGQNAKMLSLLNKMFTWGSVLALSLLLTGCGAFKKAEDPRKKKPNQEELDEIEGKRKYNPQTGKYEPVTDGATEKMDTIVWSNPPTGTTPPIGSTKTGTTPSTGTNNPTTTNDPIIYDPNVEVNSPKADQYNVALMLPFLTDRFNPLDSKLPNNADWAVGFYAGTKMAVDRLNQEGINLTINVLDTKANESATRSLLSQSALLSADMIVGPYLSRTVGEVAAFAKSQQKPMISPFTASLSVTEENPFYIQVNPSLESHCEALTRHLRKQYNPEDVIILARNNNAELAAMRYFQYANYKVEGSSNATRFAEKVFSDDSADFINEEDFTLFFKPGRTTVFVIPSWSNEGFVSNVLRKISVSKGANRVVVYGMPQWKNFDRISPDYFERLQVHISSANHVDNTASNIRAFKQDYYNRYGKLPAEEAYLGYDAVLYFGRMLHKYGKRFQYYIDRDRTQNLHTTFAFEPVVNATTTGNEDFSKIERFENKYVNVLKFEGFRWVQQ